MTTYTMKIISKRHLVKNIPNTSNFFTLFFLQFIQLFLRSKLVQCICKEDLHISWKFYSKIFHTGWYIEEKPFLWILPMSDDSNKSIISNESICRRVCEKKSSLNFMSSVGFQASKIWMFFWKIYCKASFKIIFRQKKFPKFPCFWIF